jgi:hypothetical protein
VDHQNDGGEGGKYPVGWPRVAREFNPGELDLSECDALEVWVRVDSNRDEVSDNRTPFGIVISSHAKKGALYETVVDLGGDLHKWIPVRLPIKHMMAKTGAGEEPWKSISRVQFFISEHDYPHQTRLVFDFGEVSLLRFRTPVLAGVDVPRHVLLPAKAIVFGFDILGSNALAKGSHKIVAKLETPAGKVRSEVRQDLPVPHRMALAIPRIAPGDYDLHLVVLDATGKECSQSVQALTAHAGPLYP